MTDSPIAGATAVPATTRQLATAAAIDVVSVVAFVVIGRKNHDEGGTLADTAKVAAPFLIALVAGWATARAWRAPMAVATGIVIWLVTVVLGMVLRKVVFDGGTALPFIIVATGFTLLCLVGWRMLGEWRAERAASRA